MIKQRPKEGDFIQMMGETGKIKFIHKDTAFVELPSRQGVTTCWMPQLTKINTNTWQDHIIP